MAKKVFLTECSLLILDRCENDMYNYCFGGPVTLNCMQLKVYGKYWDTSLAVAYALVDWADEMVAASFPFATDQWTNAGLALSPYAPFQF